MDRNAHRLCLHFHLTRLIRHDRPRVRTARPAVPHNERGDAGNDDLGICPWIWCVVSVYFASFDLLWLIGLNWMVRCSFWSYDPRSVLRDVWSLKGTPARKPVLPR